MPYVDLAFRLTGAGIPVDHGYALYAAVSRLLPSIHADGHVGIHPIRGQYTGGDALRLATYSRLTFRLPGNQIQPMLRLAGRTLDVDHHRLAVGVPATRPLRPAAALFARIVTIKGFAEPAAFLAALERQFQALGVDGRLAVRERRTFRVKGKQVVGFEVIVDGLEPPSSLRLQEAGLG